MAGTTVPVWPDPCIETTPGNGSVRAARGWNGTGRTGVGMLPEGNCSGDDLVQRINALCEPYRRNAIAWLEACTHRQFRDVDADLPAFLQGLTPTVRDCFVFNTGAILDGAVRYFGERR